jgi:MSHA pilin protein MshC
MRGFTIIELVVVMVLLGILVAYAAPRFSGRGGYSELTAREDVKQALRYAQQLAMTQTNKVVTFSVLSSTQIDVQVNGVSAPRPAGGAFPENVQSLYGVTVGGTVSPLTFNRYGAAVDATISVTGPLKTLNICVVGTTGYARDC